MLLLGAPIDWWDPSSFTQSLAAMPWCGLWAMKEVKTAVGDDFGYMPWPALDSQRQPAPFFGGWNEYVNGKSHNLKVALDYVRWLWIQNTKPPQESCRVSHVDRLPRSVGLAADQCQEGGALHLRGQGGARLPLGWWAGHPDC